MEELFPEHFFGTFVPGAISPITVSESNLKQEGVMNVRMLLFVVLGGFLLAGASFAQTVEFEQNWGAAGYTVVSQSPTELEIVYSVPNILFGAHAVGNEALATVAIPGVALPNNPGAPDLPGHGRFIAFPHEAAFNVQVVSSRTQIFENIDLLPAAPIQSDNDDTPPVYEKDPAIYSLNVDYPAQPVMVSEATKLRGVDAFVCGITPFAYNPVQKRLTVYTDLRIRVTFTGGTGQFGEDRLRNRWFEPLLKQHLLNYGSLQPIDFSNPPATRSEQCEYMIFSPDDPDYLSWADEIKDFRSRQGISTNVFNIADVGGSATGIENKINDAYNTWTNPPVAVLMLGDLPMMPAKTSSYGCLSDNMLADVNGDDLPDLNIARLTARDNADLDLMISKFIDYELNPPTNPNFYSSPVIAGGWQSDRWFILCCDVIWGFHSYALGKTPVREYAGYGSGYPPYWSTNTNTPMIVDYFGPSGLGYIPTLPTHLTDWGANATRINADINAGAFYMLHRDHGSPIGWGDPAYDISALSGLTNNDLCFVMSINCSTGAYDYNPECFAEAFHRMQYGALGVIAASSTSYSFVNDTFVWGMHDSMWPEFDPGYGGSTGDNVLMPGFAQTSGKWYLHASSWPYNPSSKGITYHLFHMHGDAFTQLYTEMPATMSVSHDSSIDNTATSFDVTAPAGAFIGIAMDGEVLGSAESLGGTTTVLITPPGNPGLMYVTVTQPNHIRYEGQVVVQTGGPLAIWPDDIPNSVLPGPETNVIVYIVDGVEQYVPGSGTVYYRFDPNDPFDTAQLTELGNDQYNACIPGARPDSVPEFYFSADSSGGSTLYSPPDAPNTTYSYGLRGLIENLFYDGFETGSFGPAWQTYFTPPGRIQVTSANGPIGTYHVTMDSGVDGTYCTCSMSLTLDLSDTPEADLYFMFKEFSDETDPEDNVSISEDGSTFYPVLTLEGGSSYEQRYIDLDSAASSAGISFSENFVIRFQWYDNYGITTDGFAFDEIRVERMNMNPTLWVGAYDFSGSAAFDLPIYIDAGAANANRPYLLCGSMSGSFPGTDLPSGKTAPLNWDWWSQHIRDHLWIPIYTNFYGNLDSEGEAVAHLDLIQPYAQPYIGETLTFCYVLYDNYEFVSNPVNVEIQP